jgi:hypothetical protein
VSDELDINLPADADDLSKHAPALFALKGTEMGFVVPALYFSQGDSFEGGMSERIIALMNIPEDGGLVVPENYFEESIDQIIAKTILPAKDGLTLPDNYFEVFSENLESQIALENVLPPFDYAQDDKTIPAGYFPEMESELHVHIALDNVKQEEGFVVPEGYFEDFTSRVLSETTHVALDGVHAERSRSARSDKHIHDDEVPAGYFDTLPEMVMSRIEREKKEEPGRVIVFAEWKKYVAITSVAAAVALLIMFTWTLIGNSDNSHGTLAESNLKNIVPDTYVRVNPSQSVIDSGSSVKIVAPEVVVVQSRNKPWPVKPKRDNSVIMSNEDIIAQSDVMDESMVIDFVAEGGMVQSTDEVLDADMMEYLMNDNATLDVFDPANKKP